MHCDQGQKEESVKSQEPGYPGHQGVNTALLPALPGPVHTGALGGSLPRLEKSPLSFNAQEGGGE